MRTNLVYHHVRERKRPTRRVLVGRWTGRDTTPSEQNVGVVISRYVYGYIGLHRRHGRVADAAALGNTSSEERADDDYPNAFRRVSSSHLGKSGRCQQSRHLLIFFGLRSGCFRCENEVLTKVCSFADRLGAATCLALLGLLARHFIIFVVKPPQQPTSEAKQP